jgi:hypothetical protein
VQHKPSVAAQAFNAWVWLNVFHSGTNVIMDQQIMLKKVQTRALNATYYHGSIIKFPTKISTPLAVDAASVT